VNIVDVLNVVDELREELQEKNSRKKRENTMSRTAKTVPTGKAVSAKQAYRYCKKWVSRLLDFIDNHETRIAKLEKEIEEMKKKNA